MVVVVMGIAERRARERAQRRTDILGAAWRVATDIGWATFSVEQVAGKAELGRATVYGYFESLEALVLELAKEALGELSCCFHLRPTRGLTSPTTSSARSVARRER